LAEKWGNYYVGEKATQCLNLLKVHFGRLIVLKFGTQFGLGKTPWWSLQSNH